METEVKLKDWEPREDVPHPTIVLVGKRFAGKSTTAIAIASAYKFHRWAAWCGTRDTQDYWSEAFGSAASVWGVDHNAIQALVRIVEFQQQKVELYKQLKKPFPKKYSIGLIFDDVTADRTFRKHPILEDLFANGRHYHTMILISCQYVKQLPPPVRTNSDYIFILHNTKATLRILYNEFVENPDTYDMFAQLVRGVTNCKKNGKHLYMSLVYDNCTSAEELSEIFNIFRHTEGFDKNAVQLGSHEWRTWNRTHFKNTRITNMMARVNKHAKQKQKQKQNQKQNGERSARTSTSRSNGYTNSGDVILHKKSKTIQSFQVTFPKESKAPNIRSWKNPM
jgi:hypothetical protein